MPLIFVCDPDQAIYEFRGAEPDSVRKFGCTLGPQIDLTGNWRSSPGICQLAATLRPAELWRPPDDPIGDHHADSTGILLIPTNTAKDVGEAVTTFTTRAQQLGIPVDRQLILAHAGDKLPKQTVGSSQAPSEAACRTARLGSRDPGRPQPHTTST